MKILKSALVVAMVAVLASPALARGVRVNPDRVEDRMDRRENRRDEAVKHRPLNVIEDHLDRAERRYDRRSGRPHRHHGNKVIIIK